MAKGQKRSNREIRKPKQAKEPKKTENVLTIPAKIAAGSPRKTGKK